MAACGCVCGSGEVLVCDYVLRVTLDVYACVKWVREYAASRVCDVVADHVTGRGCAAGRLSRRLRGWAGDLVAALARFLARGGVRFWAMVCVNDGVVYMGIETAMLYEAVERCFCWEFGVSRGYLAPFTYLAP